MVNKKGIDISKHNGKILWNKVKQSGIEFVICRAGYGNSENQKDATFDYNITNALANGIDCGAYWFSYALSPTDAIKEANVFLKVVEPYKNKFKYPLFFDFEYDSISYAQNHGITVTNTLIDSIANAFMSTIKNAGWEIGNYTNLDFIRSGKFLSSTIKKYPLWLADYTGDPDITCILQQTTSKGIIDGISGNVDLDNCYIDFANLNSNDNFFESDTTKDFRLVKGEYYTFKITSNNEPNMTFGTANVLQLISKTNTGKDYFFKIQAIGNNKTGTGIYVNNKKICVVNIVFCDTSDDFLLQSGMTYSFKSYSQNVTTGNSSIVKTIKCINQNGYYLVTIQAIGENNKAAGVFIDNIKQFVVTIK